MSVVASPEEIICKSTESPGVYNFGDLLNNPIIQALDQHSKLVQVLQTFCYGTYADYRSANLPDLSSAQLRKLRQLTIISACDKHRFIPYDHLLQSLELNSLRELEDLIIELFYFEAISGKLDQQKRLLMIESSIGRDFRKEDLPQLKELLESWSARVESVLNDVAQQVTKANNLKSDWIVNQRLLAASQSGMAPGAKVDEIKTDLDSIQMDIDELPEIFVEDDGASCLFGPLPSTSTGERGPRRKPRKTGK